MCRHWKFTVFAVSVGCAHVVGAPAAPEGIPRARYAVTIFDNFERAEVQACFDGFAPSRLAPMDDDAAPGLVRAWSERGALRVHEFGIDLPASTREMCVSYETRFVNEVFRARDSSAVVVSQAEWLWRPEPFPSGLDASVSIALPPGALAFLPWDRHGTVYHPERDAFYRGGYNVFGFFAEDLFTVGTTSAMVARLGPEPEDEVTRQWLARAIGAVASVGGELPAERLHFVVVPVDGMNRPVLFGMVRRGGGLSVLLIASSGAKAQELEADWVAIHELAHLWLPQLRRQDRWLSEGIATYLQEVLRARCGLQSATVSWNRIREGLERGRRSGTGRILTSETRDMHRTGAYYRVYWAGTAFALEADLRLRQESGGEMTLLRALDLAQPHWSSLQGLADAEKVLAVLDEVTGSDFLVELGTRYASSARFPGTHLVENAADKELGQQIMAVEPDRCILSVELSQ